MNDGLHAARYDKTQMESEETLTIQLYLLILNLVDSLTCIVIIIYIIKNTKKKIFYILVGTCICDLCWDVIKFVLIVFIYQDGTDIFARRKLLCEITGFLQLYFQQAIIIWMIYLMLYIYMILVKRIPIIDKNPAFNTAKISMIYPLLTSWM